MPTLFHQLLETTADATRAASLMSSHAQRVEHLLQTWLKELDNDVLDDVEKVSNIKGVIKLLRDSDREKNLTRLLGELLTKAAKIERATPLSRGVMERLLSPFTLPEISPAVLVINPGSTSTKIAWFQGVDKLHELEIHLEPHMEDTVETRTATILKWMEENDLSLSSITGIACRGGFIQPVPSGTYSVSPEMVEDLLHPKINHASNMAIFIGQKIAKKSGREEKILITTSDPVVCDEVEVVERVTGYTKIKTDGTGAHYLNHKAIHHYLASLVGKESGALNVITAHIGGGCSIVRHAGDQVTAIVDAFAGIPSANRSGQLDLTRVLDALDKGDLTMKELKAATYSQGGLLSLAGTNDFRALSAFLKRDATPEQAEKILLIFDFYAHQISKAIHQLMGDGRGVDYVAIAGGLAHSPDLTTRLKALLGDQVPLAFLPGSMEHESLAANLLKGSLHPEFLKDYAVERDTLAAQRRQENALIDSPLFTHTSTRSLDAPIHTLDELIESTALRVQKNFAPVVGIVGANNEDALLAAKRANQQGGNHIARFRLIGDQKAITELAHHCGIVIDNDNFTIDHCDDVVAKGVELFDKGAVHILMKGSLHTDEILRGTFRYLKSSGKLKKGEIISHCVVMDLPVRDKLTIISDAAVIPYPDKKMKLKIIENAIRVASYLNLNEPRIAVISAIENVNKSVASSIEADEIVREFGHREGIVLEGPLSFDVAMNQKIALEKRYTGEIKGSADVLIMPDIDAGNVLYKALTTQAGAVCAGIILASQIPIILTSRGDSAHSKLASISLSVSAYFKIRERAS